MSRKSPVLERSWSLRSTKSRHETALPAPGLPVAASVLDRSGSSKPNLAKRQPSIAETNVLRGAKELRVRSVQRKKRRAIFKKIPKTYNPNWHNIETKFCFNCKHNLEKCCKFIETLVCFKRLPLKPTIHSFCPPVRDACKYFLMEQVLTQSGYTKIQPFIEGDARGSVELEDDDFLFSRLSNKSKGVLTAQMCGFLKEFAKRIIDVHQADPKISPVIDSHNRPMLARKKANQLDKSRQRYLSALARTRASANRLLALMTGKRTRRVRRPIASHCVRNASI